MLRKANMQMTLYMILNNAYLHVNPDLTKKIRSIYDKCPDIFDGIQPCVRQEADADGGIDKDHLRTRLIGQIRDRTIDGNRSLPARGTDMDSVFRNALRGAYAQHYGRSVDIQFGNEQILWYNKFSFSDRYVTISARMSSGCIQETHPLTVLPSDSRRWVFSRGDYIWYGPQCQMGCVNQIFAHDQHNFLLVAPVDVLEEKDEATNLHKIAHHNTQPSIVTINAVRPQKVYIVQIDDEGTQVWVEWQIVCV